MAETLEQFVRESTNGDLLDMKSRLVDALALDPKHDGADLMLEWMCGIDDELEWRWSFEPVVAE